MKLHRDDLIDAVLAWTIGQLYQICRPGSYYFGQMTDGNGNFDHDKFLKFALKVNETVYRYIKRQKTLDGSCSDIECTLAHKAKYAFEIHLDDKCVMVDKAALQLVHNCLERDAQDGKKVRQEILDELKSKTY